MYKKQIRKKIPLISYILIGTALVSSIIMCHVKNQTELLYEELSILKNQIKKEQNKINTIQAELSYLSSPNRIKMLIAEYSDLKPAKISQICNNPVSDYFAAKKEKKYLASNNKELINNKNKVADKKILSNSTIKWRYKHLPAKFKGNNNMLVTK
ncbi:MAG TPA: hypothetical protein QKA14_02305 [Candidatus Megaira endosymbiont of Hartmannula sinica]|nr:hypothetical protein [Candidatus Megaera endosymbiont of Hartmannula sinica]